MSYIGLHFGIFIYPHLSTKKVEQTVVYEWIMLRKCDPSQARGTAGSKPLRNYPCLAVSTAPEIKAHNSRFVFLSFWILFQGHRLTHTEVQRRCSGSSDAVCAQEMGPLNETKPLWSPWQRGARASQRKEYEPKLIISEINTCCRSRTRQTGKDCVSVMVIFILF